MDSQEVNATLMKLVSQSAEIKGNVEMILENQKVMHGRLDAHSLRLGKMEQWRSGVLGWAAGAAAVVSIVISSLMHFLKMSWR